MQEGDIEETQPQCYYGSDQGGSFDGKMEETVEPVLGEFEKKFRVYLGSAEEGDFVDRDSFVSH